MQTGRSSEPICRVEHIKALRETIEALPQQSADGSPFIHYILIVRVFSLDKIIATTDVESGLSIINQLAEPIRSALRSKDILCKIGDSDFALVLPSILNRSIVRLAANKILSKVQSFCSKHIACVGGCYIGASVYPDNGNDASIAIHNAFMAMLLAEQTQSSFVEYELSETQQLRDNILIEQELANSLLNFEMEVYLQPQLCLRSNAINGVEVLLRWLNNPIIGNVSPAIFIPIAEETGFIEPLTDWVADRALSIAANVQSLYSNTSFSINLSTKTLKRPDLTYFIKNIIELWQVPANTVTIEITETAIMEDSHMVKGRLNALKELGVRISIDDFGTGYSSLTYLSNLPIDEIKIDKSFIDDLTNNTHNQRIVKSIINLGLNFDMEVVAEGVEDAASLELLKSFGCHKAQGYLISRPIPEPDFYTFMQAWKNTDSGF